MNNRTQLLLNFFINECNLFLEYFTVLNSTLTVNMLDIRNKLRSQIKNNTEVDEGFFVELDKKLFAIQSKLIDDPLINLDASLKKGFLNNLQLRRNEILNNIENIENFSLNHYRRTLKSTYSTLKSSICSFSLLDKDTLSILSKKEGAETLYLTNKSFYSKMPDRIKKANKVYFAVGKPIEMNETYYYGIHPLYYGSSTSDYVGQFSWYSAAHFGQCEAKRLIPENEIFQSIALTNADNPKKNLTLFKNFNDALYYSRSKTEPGKTKSAIFLVTLHQGALKEKTINIRDQSNNKQQFYYQNTGVPNIKKIHATYFNDEIFVPPTLSSLKDRIFKPKSYTFQEKWANTVKENKNELKAIQLSQSIEQVALRCVQTLLNDYQSAWYSKWTRHRQAEVHVLLLFLKSQPTLQGLINKLEETHKNGLDKYNMKGHFMCMLEFSIDQLKDMLEIQNNSAQEKRVTLK